MSTPSKNSSYAQRYSTATASTSNPRTDRFSGVGGMNCSMDNIATRPGGPSPNARRVTSPAARKSPAAGGTNGAIDSRPPFRTTPTRTSSRAAGPPTPDAATRGGRSPNAGQRRFSSGGPRATVTATTAGARPDVEREELSHVLQAKLGGLMAVREQMEELAARHRREEAALAAAVDEILRRDTVTESKTQQELVAMVAERDRAIHMLDVFRAEGQAVITALHGQWMATRGENEDLTHRVRTLEAHNEQLKEALRNATTSSTSESGGGDGSNGVTGVSGDELRKARNEIGELNEMLVEMDAIIVNLRGHNEALMATNARLRERLDVLENAELGPDEADVDVLRAALRREKAQRLEAEEQAHRLLSEHQKNVQLLEQRLRSDRTPRAATPRRSSMSISQQVQSSSGTYAQLSSPLSGRRSAAVATPSSGNDAAQPFPAVPSDTPALEEPAAPAIASSPTLVASPEGVHRASSTNSTISNNGGGSASRTASTQPVPATTAATAASALEDHAVNMKELQDIERQLQEVAASLGD